jgi:hypothetical protein
MATDQLEFLRRKKAFLKIILQEVNLDGVKWIRIDTHMEKYAYTKLPPRCKG